MKDLEYYAYPDLREEFYYKRLKNGLSLYLLPKSDYQESYAMLTSFSGSLDTGLTEKNFPEGVAHFLEHKLFEMSDGRDVMQDFTSLGADVNAFTTFDRTCYFFSTTQNLIPCLNLLQEFVQTPYFEEESITREQGIIAQEIEMYQDDPDACLYQGVLKNLYPNTALENDIAGSLESITQIDKGILEKFYAKYYHPSNLALVVAGNFDVTEVYKSVKAKQAKIRYKRKSSCERAELTYYPVIKSDSRPMEISQSKLAVGFRCRTVIDDEYLLTYKLAIRMLFMLLFGLTSKRYQDWYDSGKIDQSFDFEVEIGRDYQFVVLSLDTPEPIAMSNRIRQAIKHFEQDVDVTYDKFNDLKRELYGDFLRGFNSLEYTTNQFVASLVSGQNLFDWLTVLDELDFKTMIGYGRVFVDNMDTTDFTLFPK